MAEGKRPILLVHGLWVTPSSWEKFQGYFEARGHTVLAPAWPGITGTVESMREDPSGLNGIGIAEVLAHYKAAIQTLSEPPIIIGHSYGGLIAQLLCDQGFGAATVAIDSVPPKGIYILPLSTYLALTPALMNPATLGKTFLFSWKQFWKVFCNTLSEAESKVAYDTQAIPASGRAIFQAALSNFSPKSLAHIDFRNSKRSPLLIIGGEKDVIMPAALSRKIYGKYAGGPVPVEYKEFPGRSHYLIAEQGWEEVAEYALSWSTAQAG